MDFCRVCLKPDTLECLTPEYCEILFQITSVYIDESEKAFMCHECLKRLLHSHKFRSEALEADLWFREQVFVKQNIKNESEVETLIKTEQLPKKKRRRKALKKRKIKKGKIKNCPYICDFCNDEFIKKVEVLRHLRENHIAKEFVCPEKNCGKVFALSRVYHKHISTHHNSEPKWVCEYCAKCFSTKYKLTLHSRIHTNIRPYKCDKCPASFKQPTDLNTHLRSLHSNDRPFICTDCGLSFKIPNSLRSHRKRKHNQGKMLECDECHKKVMCAAELKQHVAIYHRGERNHACKFCSKTYTKAFHLRRHMRDTHYDLYTKLIESGEIRTVNRSAKIVTVTNLAIDPSPKQVSLSINC